MNTTQHIVENLAFIKANKLNPNIHFPNGWIEDAEAEARAAGLLPPVSQQIGINCRPEIDSMIVYGGDMAGAF